MTFLLCLLQRDIELENGSESPMRANMYPIINKTPLRPSQSDSVFSNPGTPLPITSPRLPSFSEMLSSKHKSYVERQQQQQQNNNNHINNNNHDEPMIKQHVYAKHPMGFSIPEDGPPPVTYSIPTPVAERHESIPEPLSAITVPAQPLQIDGFMNNGNMTVKMDTADIMSMDIIFEDAPIEEDTSISGNGGVNNVTTAEEFIPDANSTIFIISEPNAASTLSVVQIENAVAGDSVVVHENENGGHVGDVEPVVENGECEIKKAPVEPELVKAEETKPVEVKAPVAAPSAAPMPRKRRPPPVLVGRNTKNQRKLPPPVTIPAIAVQKSGTKEVHLSAFAPPEPIHSIDMSPIMPAPVVPPSPSVTPTQTSPPTQQIVTEQPVSKSTPSIEATISEPVRIEEKAPSPSPPNDQPEVAQHDAEASEAEAAGESNLMDSLVVVESQDPQNPDRIIHEVYVMCPETQQLSEQPLDLPDEVIQRIRLSMQ